MKLFQSHYIFRLDDIHPRMNWGNFDRIKKIFDRFGVKPMIAVIPDNKDPELMKDESKENFWQIIHDLKNDGWTVAMHGYDHQYLNHNGGIMNINAYGEFAGVSYEIQLDKIKKGKEIFQGHQLPTSLFIAPAHSFDKNTCRALAAEGFNYLSDGIAFFPFKKFGLTWIPQIAWKPKPFFFGVITYCFHTDTFSESDFTKLEEFLKKYHDSVVDFEWACKQGTSSWNPRRILDTVLGVVFYTRLRFFKFKNRSTSSKKNIQGNYTNPEAYEYRGNNDALEAYLAVKRDEYLSCELPKRTQDKVVADLGCGTGSAFSYMSKAIHIYGIDASGEMLDFAKRKYSLQNNITLLQEDSTKTSLPSEIADTVLLFGVLDYVDTNSQLVEIHRILKPGGILLIMAPNKYNFFHIAVRIRDMIRSKQSKHFMSSSKLKQQLHQYGFQVISIKSRAMIFYAPKIIRPYMKPVFAFLEMLYGPFQWLFPLGANLYIEAKKK